MKTVGPALLLCALCLVAGCAGPAYYAQAVAGHLDLMRKRQDVADLLAAAATDESLRQQLLLAREIRRYAIDRLGLPRSWDEGLELDEVVWQTPEEPPEDEPDPCPSLLLRSSL